MVKKLLLFVILLQFQGFSKEITPSEVYGQVQLISKEIHYLLKEFDVNHKHEEILKHVKINTKLKPRNVWQKSYEIMIKINILRNEYGLPTIMPVNMSPVLNLNPNLVYEQTQRILSELHIFRHRMGIEDKTFQTQIYKGKTPLDVYIGFSHISLSLDELNKGGVTPSFVFGENMRVYDDIGLILQYLNIADKTIPAKKNTKATPNDTFNTGMKILEKIKQLQIAAGIDFVDFSDFKKEKQTPSDVFSLTQMILAELQTLKAYLGIDIITASAPKYKTKTPAEVDQLMSWNLRKLELIDSLGNRR